ncbi:hypothetical protein A3H77_00250 [Candidatus Kaiserbacteria bacterium RIFCSPLOWO2_02_FULL_56_11]|uniref:AB hydrolase-1 domain-containing protein n=1 Tax=Candidatus Kaiserbacteria bacterium RIFCSPHIGHO2_12_FULL_56_13 TaxID=1798505 RepID=A0A1F6EFE1_9BACT|nr:MAG: hypothetical protein A3E65_01520 [Candidatus Kaiserbacteria bacterium RIFCSPHIGHO2_12_FULL_56_13]OGG80836.1 MAG: hypothetical protein A3H77_00250 [Candidatus Kaiserbacteria bacterium RIFCSPLOWO2_02_FULL_56_11]
MNLPQNKHTFLFAAAIVFFVCNPLAARADVVQNVHDTLTSDPPHSNGGWTQYLGTGLSGHLTDASFPIRFTRSIYYGPNFGISIVTCSDPAYLHCSGVSNNNHFTLTPLGTAGVETDVLLSIELESSGGFDFNPSRYYYFVVRNYAVNSGGSFRIYGSAIDTYPGGATNAGGLADLAFTLVGANSGPALPNMLLIPGLKGSELKIGADTVWPPAIWSDDVSRLALTSEGVSENPVVVDGLVETFYGTPIYSGFTSFADSLVADDTVAAWESLPYDWRFSPEQVITDGIETPGGHIDPIAVVEELAAQASSGKVVIVAHSMGGLVGKALIKKLESEGKESLIDSFIMVGAPQLGTPQAVVALLHGDSMGILADIFIVNPATSRTVAQNFQSAYDLLPSPRYFEEVSDPVIAFDSAASFTDTWREYWDDTVDSYTEFVEFVTGTGVPRSKPDLNIIRIPEVLRSDLTENAADFHTVYDNYEIPAAIRTVQIAGWGLQTVKAIKYLNRHSLPSYGVIKTAEGDKTVVYPSAISTELAESYYVDLFHYNTNLNHSNQHRDLLSVIPVQETVRLVINDDTIDSINYLTSTKPETSEIGAQLVISTHSPVILGVRDQNDNFTGINLDQDLEAEILSVTEDIPGSSFLSFGESQYIFLPNEGLYTATFRGIGTGPTTVEIANFANDAETFLASYSEMPVSPGTNATFVVDSATPETTEIGIDINGDGDTDLIAVPDGTEPSIEQIIALLKAKIEVLDVKKNLKQRLLKKVQKLEKKIAKQKDKQTVRVLMNLEKKIVKNEEKGKLSDADVEEILLLLEQLENAL